jgi:NAD(P)-dependent dehydrogenase (short-subunit alcohol dehydrogenase family)
VEAVVGQVLERHGRLDAVVNCVGSVVARSALATDLQQLHNTLDVGVAGGGAPGACVSSG